MNDNNQNIGISNESLTIRVMTNQIEIKQNDKVLRTVIGISVFREHVKIEPREIKSKLIKKSDTVDKEFGIENRLYGGDYLVNIIDYKLGEIALAANFLTDKWSGLIWETGSHIPRIFFKCSIFQRILNPGFTILIILEGQVKAPDIYFAYN